jgi:sugar phosphate isomerase/epimerase/HEAT repeat protein
MKCCTRILVGLLMLALCLVPATSAVAARAKATAPAAPAAAEAPKPANLDEALKALATYEFGQSREALTMIADAVRDSFKDPAARQKLVARLTSMLSGNTSTDGKRFICRQLSLVGGAESVPALAALLADKDLADIGRYALERIPDPSAAAAMRAAMQKAAGKQKVGLVNSLGERRDAPSLPAIAAALRDPDPLVAEAAAAALGKIGGQEAITALRAARATAKPEVKASVTDALLLCADRLVAEKKTDEASAIYQETYKATEPKHVQMAALRGLVAAGGEKAMPLLTGILGGTDTEMQAAALRFLRELSGPESAKTVAALLPKCSPSAQALLLEDLATRGDPSTLPAALGMVKSADAGVRLAAIQAVGKLGNASALPVLADLAAGGAGADQEAARKGLEILPGADVNPAMLALAEKGDAKVRAELLRTLGSRRVPGAMPVVLKAAEDADAGVRAAALQSLDILADEKSAPALVSLVVKAKDDKDRQAAEKALASLCGRATNKDACVDPILAAVGSADLPAKSALIRVLGRAGGTKALDAVRKFVKDSNAEIQDAAIRALADWTDASAAPDLLARAKGEGKTAVLALRGYVRLAGLPDVPAAQKLKMYQDALAAAKRPDEKRLALGGLGDMKSAEALRMVIPLLDDPSLAAEACVTAVKIAKNLGGVAEATVSEAMTKVLAVTKSAGVKKDAEDLLKQAGGAAPAKAPAKKVNKAPRVSVYNAPAKAKKEAPAAEPAPVDLGKVKKVDLSAAEALGWRLGFQAYTFRAVSFAETMDRAAAMGVKYVELFPGQKLKAGVDVKTGVGMSDDDIAEMKNIAAAAGVKIVNYGVTGIGGDEAAARKVFDFARKVGLETLVTEEHEDRFPMLEKLAEEYNMKIALHNHPKPSYYWDADHVLKAVEGFKRIGSDADTGHWMRSGLVPLDCLKKLQGHIISLHFKDLDKMGPAEKGQPGCKDVPWGTGTGDAKAMLQELKRQGFKGVFSIEYESGSGQELLDNVNKCVAWFAATAAELGK